MPRAQFILDRVILERVYPADLYREFAELVDLIAPPMTAAEARANPRVLQDMELLISSWSCPRLDAELLAQAPNLRAVFYGAGTIKRVETPEMWERGIRVTHAAAANGISVAQFTVGQILLSLKGLWSEIARTRQQRGFAHKSRNYPGLHRSRVGLVGLGVIGRQVCELLRAFDPEIIVNDPLANDETAAELGISLASLDTVFATSQVVSLHAPWLPTTEGMIDRRLLESMPPYSALINTARGALINEADLIAVLRARPDLYALLDVTHPEPPPPDSPLYDLPNLVLTPHIAGAIGANDTRRLGELMLEELRGYLASGELRWEVQRERLPIMA